MGVYAVTGNHEYIGGINQSLDYLKSIHINVLVDSIITLPNGVQLIGRNDRAAGQGKNGRKPLAELFKGIDPAKPVIVMNHQPYNLSEASVLKTDLHLSGHTHHGQMWPFNYITQSMFELSWGYLKKDQTHFYVSSGFGTWGPAMRLGNRPEVVVFELTFGRR
jgi:predicted MPP superfamily phosphohydrolase